MKLGFVTACLADESFEQVVGWASAAGYDSVEVSAWPSAGELAGPSHIDVRATERADYIDRVQGVLGERGVEISALGFYDNNLHPDPERRRSTHDHLRACMGRTSEWDVGWWRYRVPGGGQVDWHGLLDVLCEGGFDGHIAVEHEDPVWGGTPDRTRTGLEIALETLRPLVR